MRHLFGLPVSVLSVVLGLAMGAALAVVIALAVRNRIFFKLGLRNMTRRRGRTAIIVAGLMLGTAIIASALGTGDTMAQTIRSSVITSLGATDEVVSARTAGSDSASTLGQATGARYLAPTEVLSLRTAARDIPQIDGLTPAISEPVAVQDRTSRRNEARVTLFAADPTSMAGFGSIRRADGRSVSLASLRPGEVFLNQKAADEIDARVGHELLVLSGGHLSSLRVAGIVAYDGTGTDSYAMLLPLGAAQKLLGVGDRVQEVLVTNHGDALTGVTLTSVVERALAPTVDLMGLEVHPVKKDGLDLADKQGASFLSMFTTFGTFTISAGILLIFLIFVMLAAERRSEMGTARAIGTQRGHLVAMFLFEGVAYDLLAAAIGSIIGVGVALGMVRLIAGALSSSGITVRYSIQARSILLAYAMGMLLTLVVVTLSAWRVSRLNVVSAVRNLPEPTKPHRRRNRWALGLSGVALGGLLATSGATSAQAASFLGGVAVVLASAVPIARAVGLSERLAFSIGGMAVTVWCLLPFRVYDAMVPGLKMNFSVWVLSGLLLVIGATWLVIYNTDVLLGAAMWLFGRIRALAPVLKTSIAQPLRNRFRTGTTIALFTLVVFTLVVGATTSNAFMSAMNDQRTFDGGFQIAAQTSPMSPIPDMPAALRSAPGIRASDIRTVAGQSFIPVEARQGTAGGYQSYPMRGLDSTFTSRTTYGFAAMARGYSSDRQVWAALATHPNLAVVDSYVVPRRANWGFGVMPKFRVHGFYLEDRTFNRFNVQVRVPQTSKVMTLTVIGVLRDTTPVAMAGISTSQQTVSVLGAMARPTVWYFQLAKGVQAVPEAKALESAFLSNGMQAKAQSQVLHDTVSSSLTFQWLILGFLGLGLIIGVAALGVISARAVVERRQQIGVLRAIGFQRRMVQLSFLLESSFVTLVGIVVGTGLALLTAYNVIADSARQPSWGNLRFAPPWLALGAILVTVFAASLATTYLPALRASRVYPAEALRYE